MMRAVRAFRKVREDVYESIANSMMKDGVPLKDCISRLAARAIKDKDPIAPLYKAWINRMGDANMHGEFTSCIRRDVPNSDYMVLRGFEASGDLAGGIYYQSQLIGKMRKMKSDFIMTLIKPAITVVVAILLSAFFATVSTSFLEVAPMERWPELSRWMFTYTIFMSDYLLMIVISLIVTGSWITWSMSNWGKRNVALRHKLDQHMPYILYRDFTSFSTMVVLSSLMSSGMSLKVAAQSIMESGSPWLKSYFRKIIRRMGDSSIASTAVAFDVGFFPKRIYYRVVDASEQGGFEEAIKRIADDSFDRMERDMKKRAFVLDQLSVLFAGVIIALIAAGLASAIGEIQNLVRG